jgi:hypothetical protein
MILASEHARQEVVQQYSDYWYDEWCFTISVPMNTTQPFVLFLNCASGLPPGSTVSEVWGDSSSIPANSLSPVAQVDCPSGSTATSAAFYTANASAFTLSELTLGATGTFAQASFDNLASTDMQAQIGPSACQRPVPARRWRAQARIGIRETA